MVQDKEKRLNMKSFVIFFILFLFQIYSVKSFSSNPASSKKMIFEENRMIKPGEVRWVSYTSSHPSVSLKCDGKSLKVDKKQTKDQKKFQYFAIVRETYFSDFKPFKCFFLEGTQKVYSIVFNVVERKFKEERLRVSPRTIKLSDKDQKRAKKEQLMLNKIYASSANKIQFNTAFSQPLSSTITSFYGTKRVYNKKKKGQHLGTDYRAPIGVKIPASNSGRVAFSGDLFYTGWTVIIDHGLDIFSVYGHLSKTLVKTGDFVEKGQIIAQSGNTGRTSGPHLHWGVKVQGQYIDGLVMVDESKKIFQE